MAQTIVFLDRETLPESVTVRAPSFAHTWTAFDRSPPVTIAERIRDASILIVNKTRIDAETLAKAPNLELIAVAATGTDCVDKTAAAAQGIVICNVRGYATAAVPEHTMALLLAVARGIVPYHRSIAAGRWAEATQFCYVDYPIMDLHGKVMGLIGHGTLGAAVGNLAEAFGIDVRIAGRKGDPSPPTGRVAFDEILRDSDIISLHCPLTPETHNLIGPDEFAQMTKRPILLNTSRGGLVDEQALIAALDSGQISGAGFDVATSEPMPADHPFMSIMDRPNFVLTPHVAWASDEAMQNLADQLIDNLEAFVAGTPQNVVAP